MVKMNSLNYFMRLDDNKIKCTACNRYCVLSKDQTGFCKLFILYGVSFYSVWFLNYVVFL